MRRIAETRLSRGALEHDGAGISIRKSFYPRIFFAKPTHPDSKTIGESNFRPQNSSESMDAMAMGQCALV